MIRQARQGKQITQIDSMLDNKPKRIFLSPHMGGEELQFIKEAFQSNYIAPVGPQGGAGSREHGAGGGGKGQKSEIRSQTSGVRARIWKRNG